MYHNDYKGLTIVGDSELCNSIHLACHAELKNNEWRIVWELTDGQKNGRREILEKRAIFRIFKRARRMGGF